MNKVNLSNFKRSTSNPDCIYEIQVSYHWSKDLSKYDYGDEEENDFNELSKLLTGDAYNKLVNDIYHDLSSRRPPKDGYVFGASDIGLHDMKSCKLATLEIYDCFYRIEVEEEVEEEIEEEEDDEDYVYVIYNYTITVYEAVYDDPEHGIYPKPRPKIDEEEYPYPSKKQLLRELYLKYKVIEKAHGNGIYWYVISERGDKRYQYADLNSAFFKYANSPDYWQKPQFATRKRKHKIRKPKNTADFYAKLLGSAHDD